MDRVLGKEGKNFSYLVDFVNGKSQGTATSAESKLIKLHGSLNWFYCETCQEVYLIDIKKTVKEYVADESCYSVIAVCKECGGQRRGLLVPPLAMKFDVAPPLTPLLEKAKEAFRHADVIIVVGFSFAEADYYISRMLTKALQSSKNAKIVIFDPDPGVVEKLRRQFAARISGFDEKRILRVVYNCAEALPAFLTGRLKRMRFETAKSSSKSPKRKAVRIPAVGERKVLKRRSTDRRVDARD